MAWKELGLAEPAEQEVVEQTYPLTDSLVQPQEHYTEVYDKQPKDH